MWCAKNDIGGTLVTSNLDGMVVGQLLELAVGFPIYSIDCTRSGIFDLRLVYFKFEKAA